MYEFHCTSVKLVWDSQVENVYLCKSKDASEVDSASSSIKFVSFRKISIEEETIVSKQPQFDSLLQPAYLDIKFFLSS